jgi:hypothetical protein
MCVSYVRAIMSRICVTTDGVWIAECTYCALMYTRLVSTSYYSATADLHNSQITTEPSKPLTSRSLVTASNSRDSSALRPQVLYS